MICSDPYYSYDLKYVCIYYRKYNRMSALSILAPSQAAEPSSLLNIRVKLLENEHK